jgi:hypothetical protein
MNLIDDYNGQEINIDVIEAGVGLENELIVGLFHEL